MERGFTLIELIVTISIFLIVSSLILANYPAFSQRLALNRTVQEVALSLREAQSYALAVRETASGSGLFPGYGIHFSADTPKQYILFADIDGDTVFDQGQEEIETFTIQTFPSITALCGGTETAPPGDCSLGELDITYVRPDPTITLKSGIQSFSDTKVIVGSNTGDQRSIILWITGQISIE